MKLETVKSLHARAKKLGLTGYSKLRKDELLKLITNAKHKNQVKVETSSRNAASQAGSRKRKPRRAAGKPAGGTAAKPSPVSNPAPASELTARTEQQVESAKYAFALPGAQEPTYIQDLGEDIDRLPSIREPLLFLLPQKPGVLHGYWAFPPASLDAEQSARLRLATFDGDRLTILGEHSVVSEKGHYYFHVDDGIELGTVYLQLGRYQHDGEFVSIIQRGIARIPSLYASARTDRRWWVSDAQFRDMYRRAGGLGHNRQLGWTGIGNNLDGSLAWPGNASSR